MNMNIQIQKILTRAKQHEHAGRMHEALLDYSAALNAAPESITAHHTLGLFFLKQNQLNYAHIQFNNVLALYPNHIDALFYSGLLRLNEKKIDQAEQYFQKILNIEPEHVQSIVNIGVIALQRNQGQAAINHFTRALALDENHPEAKNNLAATFMHHDRFESALVYYNSLLTEDAYNPEYNYNSGVSQMALGHLDKATKHFEIVLTNQNNFKGMAYSNLAAIQLRLGQRDRSITLLENAVNINPEDYSSKFMLAALTQQSVPTSTCTSYVENLFDNYALYYDNHLKTTLQSTLPEQLVAALHSLGYVKFAKTLDLGCGTGLSGIVLREMSAKLSGVDLSEKMLSQAMNKELYDELIHSEICTFLENKADKYDLIMAADVLPYYGELELFFKQTYEHLVDHGLLIFNIEISKQMPWHLQDSIRFSHHPNYILELCQRHDFSILLETSATARLHENDELTVMIYIIQSNEHK